MKINSNLVSSEIKCTTAITTRFSLEPLNHIDQSKNKPQDLLVNTSNPNRVLYIVGCDQCRNSTHRNMTRISQRISVFVYTLIRLIKINQHNYQQS